MKMQTFEPIAAVSTPYGRGGIAVIRMSGEGSIPLAENMFKAKSGKKLSELESNRTVYGDIILDGKRIDDGMVTVFRAPNSYTGEDTVEISCHGGIILTEQVLSAAFTCGFRHAGGGEFTKRAFLNGKISLSRAEAVIGLIDAENAEQLKLSSSITSGVLSDKILELGDRLTDILASVYAYIDYPDEDLTDMSREELILNTEGVLKETNALCGSYRTGRAVCEGIRTAIVGKPNAGKSSLLNQLLGYDRAIVTDIPGTTRDTIEETASIGRVTLRLCDTAGIRQTADEVERLGVGRSLEKLRDAELVIAVFDGSKELDELDRDLLKILGELTSETVYVVNKCDVCENKLDLPKEHIEISALNGEGIDALKEHISGLFVEEKLDYNSTPVIVNARQHSASVRAKEHLTNALDALKSGFTQDIAGMDLELALASLREIDGKGVNEEITDRIFSRFCVGK